MTYHVGITKRGNTMVIEARRSVDYLSCELYDYMGRRETTKRALYDNRYRLMELMKERRPDVYNGLRYAIVD